MSVNESVCVYMRVGTCDFAILRMCICVRMYSTYVCMYVCMYVCTRESAYVCAYVCVFMCVFQT